MKILHIITSLELGGAEKLLLDLIPAQKRMGKEVAVLVLDTRGEKLLFEYEKHRIKIYSTKINNKFSFKNIFEISKLIRKNKFDIVHSHLIHAQIWTSLNSYFNRTPIYITTEHSTHNRRRDSRMYKILDRVIYSSYKKIICISEATKDGLLNWIKIKNDKIDVIPNGIALKNFLGKPKKKLGNSLIMVSRFHASKDHITVVQAMKKLPLTYTLTFVGYGETQDKIEKEVMMSGLESRVQFLGYSSNVNKLLKKYDIAIQSSHYEGFALTAIEAMASGTPVVVSDVAGLSQVVGKAGLLFKVGDVDDLVEKIRRLEDDELYSEKSKLGIEASLNYTIEKMAKRYICVYEKELKLRKKI